MADKLCSYPPMIVSDLLSSFINTSERTENSTKERHCATSFCQDDHVACQPQNKDKFDERVHTFSSLTWSAKPAWLSPYICAKYGWQNVDKDILQCVNCQAYVSCRLPDKYMDSAYEECCKKLCCSVVREAHNPFCSWISNPSPDRFLQVTFHERMNTISSFHGHVNKIISLGNQLPLIDDKCLQKMDLTEEVLRQISRHIESCEDQDQSVILSACLLTLCGWTLTSSSTTSCTLQCQLCRRTVGLWNYYRLQDSPPDQFEKSLTDIPGYGLEHEMDAGLMPHLELVDREQEQMTENKPRIAGAERTDDQQSNDIENAVTEDNAETRLEETTNDIAIDQPFIKVKDNCQLFADESATVIHGSVENHIRCDEMVILELGMQEGSVEYDTEVNDNIVVADEHKGFVTDHKICAKDISQEEEDQKQLADGVPNDEDIGVENFPTEQDIEVHVEIDTLSTDQEVGPEKEMNTLSEDQDIEPEAELHLVFNDQDINPEKVLHTVSNDQDFKQEQEQEINAVFNELDSGPEKVLNTVSNDQYIEPEQEMITVSNDQDKGPEKELNTVYNDQDIEPEEELHLVFNDQDIEPEKIMNTVSNDQEIEPVKELTTSSNDQDIKPQKEMNIVSNDQDIETEKEMNTVSNDQDIETEKEMNTVSNDEDIETEKEMNTVSNDQDIEPEEELHLVFHDQDIEPEKEIDTVSNDQETEPEEELHLVFNDQDIEPEKEMNTVPNDQDIEPEKEMNTVSNDVDIEQKRHLNTLSNEESIAIEEEVGKVSDNFHRTMEEGVEALNNEQTEPTVEDSASGNFTSAEPVLDNTCMMACVQSVVEELLQVVDEKCTSNSDGITTADVMADESSGTKRALTDAFADNDSKLIQKKRRLQVTKTMFDPVSEHKSWCPWIVDNKEHDRHLKAIASGHTHCTVNIEHTAKHCGWRKYLEILQPVGLESSSILNRLKTASSMEAIQKIRQLLHGWTSSTRS